MNSINAFVVRSGIRTTRIGAALIVPLVLTACGSSTPAATPTTLAAPNLANITSTQNLTVDTEATITFVNSGGDVTATTGCMADANLPQGLEIAVVTSGGKRTCQITGMPEVVVTNATYTVTGTNTTGNNGATVSITVAPASALAVPDLANITDVQNLTVNTPATITFANNGGGALIECAASPNLPEGLSVVKTTDNSSCQITGAPAAAAVGEDTYTVTATNGAGPDLSPATISITVAEAIPLENCSDVEKDDAEGYPIDALTVPSVSGSGNSKLYVRGVHSDWMAQEEFLLKHKGDRVYQAVAVFDSDGAVEGYNARMNMFKIADDADYVNQLWVPGTDGNIDTTPLAQRQDLKLVSADSGLANNLVALTEGATYSFLFTLGENVTSLARAAADAPANEVGTLHIQQCQPSQGPAGPVAGENFSVLDATGASGDNTITITTTTNGFTSTVNTNTPGIVSGTTSPKMTFEVATASPAEAGEVTVTVTEEPGMALFTTLFTDDLTAGPVTQNFSQFAGGNIVFELSSPNWGNYNADNGMFMKVDHNFPNDDGTTRTIFCDCNTPLDVNGLGTNVWKTFTIPVNDLVTSKSLNLENISTGIVIFPNLVIQGTNAELTFKVRNVRWEVAEPNLSNAQDQSFISTVEIEPIVFENTGGNIAVDGCSLMAGSTLPAGLEVSNTADNSSCQITGTPNAVASPTQTTATIVATNAYTTNTTNNATTNTATVDITVTEPAPDLQAQTVELTATLPTVITLVNNGANVDANSCSEMTGSTLPAGLEVSNTADNSSCQITGAPNAVATQATYTIVATTAAETSTATLTIQVNPLPTIPTVCQQDMDYTSTDADGYPVTVTGNSERLYLRGNHSDWKPHPRFLFRHKGRNTYQMAAVFDNSNAADDYDAAQTMFKIASDDGSWTTQLYVQTADAAATTDIDTTTRLTDGTTAHALAKSDGMGLSGKNNLADLTANTANTAYLFTMILNAADPLDGISVGTLTIKACADNTLPTVTADTTTTTGTTATLTFTSDEAGTASVLVREVVSGTSPTPPTVAAVKASATTETVIADTAATVTLTELTINTAYVAYIVVSDGVGNDSAEVSSTMFTTSNILSPPNLANIDELIILEVEQAANIEFVNSGDAPDATGGCAITMGTLPTSLTLARTTDGRSCMITGTPVAGDTTPRTNGNARHFDAISYEVTAQNTAPAGATGGGSGTPATVSILIVAAQDAPPALLDPSKTAQNELRTLVMGQTYADIGADSGTDLSSAHIDVPVNLSDTSLVTDCQLETGSSLPAGLTVQPASNLASCIIVGTPTAASVAPATYTIVASNSQPNAATGTIRLEVIAAAPDAPTLVAPDAQIYQTNMDITPLIITNEGGRITAGGASNCTVTSAEGLPAGLNVKATADGQNCQIFGRPTMDGETDVIVTATNSEGSDTSDEFAITVDGTAPMISAVDVPDATVTATTATLNFTSSEAGTASYVVLRTALTNPVAATDITGHVMVAKTAATTGANSVSLTGLTAGTPYFVYVVVTDVANNNSAVNADGTFTTAAPPDTTAPVIANDSVSVSAITATTATLNFTSDEAGTASYVVLRTALTNPVAATAIKDHDPAATTAATTTGANSVSLTGLTAETLYFVYVVVTDAAGNDSAVNADGTFTTAASPDTTAPVIANDSVSVSAITATTATLNFTSDEAGTASYVVLRTALTNPVAATAIKDHDPAATTAATTTGANSVSLTGLTAETLYFVYVVVTDAAGNDSAVNADGTFTTAASPDTTAPVITSGSVSVSAITATTATLNFTSSEAGTASYVVLDAALTNPVAATAIKDHDPAATTAATTTGANSVSLTGLTAGTPYFVYVVVTDAAGNDSAVNADGTFTTAAPPDTTAPVIANDSVSVSAITATTATLNFTSDEAGTASIVVLPEDSENLPTDATDAAAIIGNSAAMTQEVTARTPATVSLTGLTTGTVYKVYIVVNDGAGDAGGNNSAVFETEFRPEAPDTTAPAITITSAFGVTTTTATLTFTSSEIGTASISVLVMGSPTPTVADIKRDAITTSSAIAADSLGVEPGSNNITLSGLEPGTSYTAYMVVTDLVSPVGNDSGIVMRDFTTLAATAMPNLANIEELRILEVGQVANIEFVNSGGAPDATGSCASTPALPMTLTLATSGDTCAITGTPEVTDATSRSSRPAGDFEAITYSVTATNGGGESTAATVSILIVPAQTAMPTVSEATQNVLRTLIMNQAYADIGADSGTDLSSAHIDVPVNFSNNALVTDCQLETGSSLPAGLTVQPASNLGSCIIVGTPIAPADPATYTIMASNRVNSATGTIRLEVIEDPPGAPMLVTPPLRIYKINTDVTPLIITNNGGRITAGGASNCTARRLPAGLKIKATADGQNCEIFGRPTTEGNPLVGVTATNSAGSSDTADFSITIDGTAPDLRDVDVSPIADTTATLNFISSETGDVFVLVRLSTENTPDVATVKTAGNRQSANANIAATVALTGLEPGRGYTVHIVATDFLGNDSAVNSMTTFTTTDTTAPAITNISVSDATVTDTATATATLTFTSDEVGTARIVVLADGSPEPDVAAVKMGAIATDSTPISADTFDVEKSTNNIVLSGLALGRAYAVYLVVTDSADPTANDSMVSGPHEIITPALPNLASIAKLRVLEVGQEALIAFANTGSERIGDGGCVITAGTLPGDLIAEPHSDGRTCAITGTPVTDDITSGSAPTYELTATNSVGSDSTPATVSILIVATQTTALTVSEPEQGELRTLVVGQTYADIGADSGADLSSANIDVPVSGGLVTKCRLSSESSKLPAGLTVQVASNLSSCIIVGTPTVPAGPAIYIITASNSATDAENPVTGTIRLEVIATAPFAPNLVTPPLRIYKINTDVTPLIITNNGGRITAGSASNCTAAGLPTGLKVKATADGQDCQIFGRPTMDEVATTVTVTATNSAGFDTTDEFTITVDGTAPDLSDVSVSPIADTTATLNFTITEAGDVFVLVRLSTENTPDVARIKSSGDEQMVDTGAATVALTGLEPGRGYTVHIVATDEAGNDSVVNSMATFTTTDTAGPDITNISVSNVSGTTATLTFTSDEVGTASILVLAQGSPAPDVDAVKTGTITTSSTPISASNFEVKKSSNSIVLSGLASGTTYDAYLVVTDSADPTPNNSMVSGPHEIIIPAP